MIKNAYTLLVNPSHPLDAAYIPESLTEPDIPFHGAAPKDPKRLLQIPAARAAEELFRQARGQALCLQGISGYRSYQRQKELYQVGSAYVAPPGCSEHQTGLALDVSCPAIDGALTEAFARTAEYRFLKKYGPAYGFILRYPQGKENITGYAWEPWHIRFVSKVPAIYISNANITLEDYHH